MEHVSSSRLGGRKEKRGAKGRRAKKKIGVRCLATPNWLLKLLDRPGRRRSLTRTRRLRWRGRKRRDPHLSSGHKRNATALGLGKTKSEASRKGKNSPGFSWS